MKTPAFVAEVSANHLGRQERAAFIVDRAAAAGADGVKFQTYDPKRLVGNHKLVLEDGPWAGRKMLDLYKEAATPRSWLPDLFALARARGVVPFSSPFAPEDVDFLEGLDCPIYKIASFEITDLDLIAYAAATKKPLVISTGMAKLPEIEDAVEVALRFGAEEITLLKCTSGYPHPVGETNLATMKDLGEYFGDARIVVGLSDHTLGITAAIAAVALGAVMIEKHLTIYRADGGPDAAFSSEPGEFEAMVRAGREAYEAIGEVRYGPTESEESQTKLRRALWVVADVAAGEAFTRSNLRSARPCLIPGAALLPIGDYLGRVAARAIKAGTIFEPELIG